MRPRSRHYDKQGNPITTEEWAALHGETYTEIGDYRIGPYWVSTVWLGVNHNHHPFGPPVIFTTTIFDQRNAGLHYLIDTYSQHYATEEEAIIGHHVLCGEAFAAVANEILAGRIKEITR
jgi:hypothetical protein